MGEKSDSLTSVERTSERELMISRTFNAPAHIVFAAWTQPDLFVQWWVPKSTGVPLLSCEMDVRTGGGYRLTFGHDASSAMAFFGTYTDVAPNARLVWTNEESQDGAVTTVTFTERDGKTLLVLRDLYPSKRALDDAFIGMEGGMVEQFLQLDELLAAQGAGGS